MNIKRVRRKKARPLFVVMKMGQHLSQEFAGALTSLELAMAAATTLITGERDDYHTYDVRGAALDVAVTQGPLIHQHRVSGGDIVEGEVLASFSRVGTVVSGGLC